MWNWRIWNWLRPRPGNLRVWQVGLLVAVFAFWHLMTTPGLLPLFMFDNDRQAAFFFGEPLVILERLQEWFMGGEIYRHLGVTLLETMLAFVIGTLGGVVMGLWLALRRWMASSREPQTSGL
jgi:NitT/TauT family transport system permease protein